MSDRRGKGGRSSLVSMLCPSHRPQTIPALRKHCLPLPEVILMGTDVFMIINKISKGEFYGHMETLKSRSLL